MLKGFFAKKSGPKKEKASPNKGNSEHTSLSCSTHGNPGEMICECKTEILCEDCYDEHVGMEHRKIFIHDISKTLPQALQKKLQEAEAFSKSYKSTESGKFFDAYIDFFEKSKEAAVHLREHYDKEDPWSKQTPMLAKFAEGKTELFALKDKYNKMRHKEEQDFIDMYKEYNKISTKIDTGKSELFAAGAKSNKIFSVQYNREHVKGEIKNYLNALFLTIFKPELAGALPNAPVAGQPNLIPGQQQQLQQQHHQEKYQELEEFAPIHRPPRPPKEKYFMAEEEFDDDVEFLIPEFEEDFDVVEGQTLKGHQGAVRDIIKINHNEFISSDDSGQVIIWNLKENKMKGITLKQINAPFIEPILCVTLTEDRGKFLVGGLKKGHLLIYNRSKGGKKFIRDAVRKNADVVAITDLEHLNSKCFVVQDSRFIIRMFSADKLYYDLKDDQRAKPLLEIVQKGSEDGQSDIYYGDNKLIEMVTTEFAGNKNQDITFILSCVSALKVVNLYVIDGLQTKLFCCIKAAPMEWQYQHLREIQFEHSPTSLLELSNNRVAIATGLEIEIVDIHSENKARLILEGHTERIRTLTMMSRKTKIIAKSQRIGRQEIMQNTDFLISSGDDRTIRIWKIPPPLSTKQMRKMMEGQEIAEVEDQEYCILNIETRHNDCIYSLQYLNEAVASGSKDGVIKIYSLDMKFLKVAK